MVDRSLTGSQTRSQTGNNIRSVLNQLGITNFAEFERKIGWGRQSSPSSVISALCSGRKVLTIEILAELAEKLDITMDELYYGKVYFDAIN